MSECNTHQSNNTHKTGLSESARASHSEPQLLEPRTRSKPFENGRKRAAVRHELLEVGASLAPNATRSRKLIGAIFGTYASVSESCIHFKRRIPSRLACWKFRARRKAELAAMSPTLLMTHRKTGTDGKAWRSAAITTKSQFRRDNNCHSECDPLRRHESADEEVQIAKEAKSLLTGLAIIVAALAISAFVVMVHFSAMRDNWRCSCAKRQFPQSPRAIRLLNPSTKSL